MTNETRILYSKSLEARSKYRMGVIRREKAQEIIDPYIQAYNEKTKEISKKYNQRPKFISFSIFVR